VSSAALTDDDAAIRAERDALVLVLVLVLARMLAPIRSPAGPSTAQ